MKYQDQQALDAHRVASGACEDGEAAARRRRMSKAWMCGHAVKMDEVDRVQRFQDLLAEKPFLWFNQASCGVFAAGLVGGVLGGASSSSWVAMGSGSYGFSALFFLGVITMAHREAAGIMREAAMAWTTAVASLGVADPAEAANKAFGVMSRNGSEGVKTGAGRSLLMAVAMLGENPAQAFIKPERSAFGALCLKFSMWSSSRMTFGQRAAESGRMAEERLDEQEGIDIAHEAIPGALALAESLEIELSVLGSGTRHGGEPKRHRL